MKKTGFISDESYFWHDNGSGALMLQTGGWIQADVYGESPETKRRVKNLLERTKFIKELAIVEPREATYEEILAVHQKSYIDRMKELSDTTGGDAGIVAIVGKGSYEIALLSAGGAIAGVEAVMEGEVENAYALTRPPGHHATAQTGMGFCIFNNVAVAAELAREKYGIQKILIVDWDVHHGNGTESIYYDDPNVLCVSIHQELNFPPDQGFSKDIGSGAGEGYNVNIPLPAGSGDAAYLYAFEELIAPIADQFEPELILVSAGQDANPFDPLAQMMLTAEGYKSMATVLKGIAERHCSGRLVAIHEGGYSTAYVPFCTLRVIEGLSGLQSAVIEDPYYEPALKGLPYNILKNHQKEAIDEVIATHRQYWDIQSISAKEKTFI